MGELKQDENLIKKKKKRLNFILGLVFFLGFLIAIYPIISQLYYRQVASNEVTNFDKEVKELTTEETKKRIELANAYNRTLDPSRISDPFTSKELEGRREYAKMLELSLKIGHIEVPQIGEDLPVYAGTSEEILSKGAGHLEGSSLPVGGESTHAVITAHRGLPSAKLFRELNKLKKGDVFYFHNIEGVLAYEVDRILTVEPSNFEPVLVEKGKDYMTLLTCTPYMINSHRLLVRGHRVSYKPALKVEHKNNKVSDFSYREYFRIALAVIVLLLFIFFIEFSSLQKAKKKFRILKNKRDKDEEE